MKAIIVISIFTAAIMFYSCTNKSEVKEEGEVLPENIVEMNSDMYKMAGIQLGKLDRKVLGNIIMANGFVGVPPQNLVTISANLGGFVKQTDMVQGSPVSAGQVVAVIENPEFIQLQQDYLESSSQLEYTKAEYNRQESLFKENVSSEKTFQQVQADYKSLQAKVLSLEQKLASAGINLQQVKEGKISRTVAICSPISGYIKTANVNIGKYVNPTDVMFEIINNQKMTLELTLFEKDIYRVNIGQNIRFSVPDKPESEYGAVIFQVGKAINDDKTIKIYANVSKTNSSLLSGMYVNAVIETDSNLTDALPDEAIVSFDDRNYIFVFKGIRKEENKEVSDFEMVEVARGISNNGFTEIILPAGFDKNTSNIVLKGAYNLLSAKKNAGEMSC